jgi:hypothetical protein
MATKMVIDTANLLFRVAAMNKGKTFGTAEEQAGLALHVSFQSVFKYYKKFKPDQIAFTFEGQKNWRKTYTKSNAAVSGNQYKANRVKDASMEPYFALMDSFREVMQQHTSAIILRNEVCEGDDMFAAYVQANSNGVDTIVGISGDRDFTQLYKCPGFKLINPDSGNERNQPGDKEYYEDIDYFLFKKCVRGDMGDYVFSAYPRVREDKIKMAYADEKYRAEFMRNTWDIKDDDGNVIKTNVVGELFEENKLLMNLFCQPDDIREVMFQTVKDAETNIGTYSNFHFLRFLGKHKLNAIAEHIDQFTDMLSCNTRYKKSLALAAESGEVFVPAAVAETKRKSLLEW